MSMKNDADVLRGEVAFLEAESKRLKGQLARATQDAVDVRCNLVLAARKVVPGFRHDGMSNAEITRQVVSTLHPELDTGALSDDFLSGYLKLASRS